MTVINEEHDWNTCLITCPIIFSNVRWKYGKLNHRVGWVAWSDARNMGTARSKAEQQASPDLVTALTNKLVCWVFFPFNCYKKLIAVNNFIVKMAFPVTLCASSPPPFFFLFACFENSYWGSVLKHKLPCFSLEGDGWEIITGGAFG